jgi:mono/diheme cytochrome c family protein
MTLSTRGKAFLYLYPSVVVILAWVGVPFYVKTNIADVSLDHGQLAPAEVTRGQQLYEIHCTYCHGPDGQGNGPAYLEPRARYFGWEKFKFVTTKNSIPTDNDLKAVIRRGIPGSAMPAFDQFSDADLTAIIEHIRVLSRKGVSAREAKKLADDFDPNEHQNLVSKRVEPGETLEIPQLFKVSDPAAIANGKKIYAVRCVGCHGASGEGDGQQEITTEEGRPIRPRDLTHGIYRGGDSNADLYARIALGIGGKAMPTNLDLKPDEIQDVVLFVKSLVKSIEVKKEEMGSLSP